MNISLLEDPSLPETEDTDFLECEGSPQPVPLLPSRVVARFLASIKAIEDVLDYETQTLESHGNPDFKDIHARKERAIHALNLIWQENPQIDEEENRAWIVDALLPLRTKLERNEKILKIHHDAVGELVEMMSAVAQAHEADGTYSPFISRKS